MFHEYVNYSNDEKAYLSGGLERVSNFFLTQQFFPRDELAMALGISIATLPDEEPYARRLIIYKNLAQLFLDDKIPHSFGIFRMFGMKMQRGIYTLDDIRNVLEAKELDKIIKPEDLLKDRLLFDYYKSSIRGLGGITDFHDIGYYYFKEIKSRQNISDKVYRLIVREERYKDSLSFAEGI